MPDQSQTKVYLGDGVYVDNNGYQIILTTENGIETNNVIYFEAETLENFQKYIKSRNPI